MLGRRWGKAAKIVLDGLFYSGVIVLAVSSPFFIAQVIPRLLKYAALKEQIKRKRFYNAFYNLRKRGLIKIKYCDKQIYISLTPTGKKVVGKYQVDDLKIAKPASWDGKWRILIFDIKEKEKVKREALRGKLKQLGLYQLQKSVWVYPYDFYQEASLLRDFFGLKKQNMKFIIASVIEDDSILKNHFKV